MANEELQLRPKTGNARQIARGLLKNAKITEAPIHLPTIINYLKSQYDLDVQRVPLGEKISGLLVMIDGCPTIGFNADQVWVRRRFSIAHEIGHLLMGHTSNEQDEKSQAEAEANQFAAELLVPLHFIKKDYQCQPDLNFLAQKYLVSKEMLCRHLIDCHIL